jgi:hypothetical protein
VTSGDLLAAADLCAGSVRRLDAELWDKLAYGLEWTRSRTAAHIGDALDFYSGDLATRVQENPGSRGLNYKEGSVAGAAGQIEYSAAVLAIVADEAPAGTRAFHATGSPDAEGFLAMGCVEILLHGYDAVAGTEAEFDPDDGLCRRVLGRLFPWAPENQFGWLTLLWATGRGEIEGQEFIGESWVWHNDLLSEWEENVPRL